MGTYREKCVFNFWVDDSKDIKDGTQQMIRKLLECIVEADYIKIDEMLKTSKAMRYAIQGYEEDIEVSEEIKSKLISAGYTSALIDTMQLYIEKISIQNEILKVNTKYRDVILRALAKRGTLLHGDLASILGVSPSGLNAIIKQMNGTSVPLINVEKISKYTLYSITPIAYKYIMKREEEYLPRKDNSASRYGVKGYIQTSKYKERGYYEDAYMEYRSREALETIEMLKIVPQSTFKYGEKMNVDTPILKFERRLA